MTEEGVKKFIDKIPDIYINASKNREYFSEAVRVCEGLCATEPSFEILELKEYLKKMSLINFSILNEINEITTIYIDAFNGENFEGINFYLIATHIKKICENIDEFEERRQNALANAEFKKHIEPRMSDFFKNLVNNETEETNKSKTDDGDCSQCEEGVAP